MQSLSASEKQILYHKMGLNSEEDLFSIIHQQDDMYIKPYEEPLMQYSEYKAHKILMLYVPPLLLVLGSFGNILSFCVLMCKAMRRTSTYNYLAVLSLTDMLVLYVGLLRLWVGELTGYDLRDQFDWSCKVITMVGYTMSVYSVWLLIAVTVERYIVIVHSLHAATMCTRSRAIKVIMGIFILVLTLHVHFLVTIHLRDFPTQGMLCTSKLDYEFFVINMWPWIDAILYSLLPFVVIILLNSLIIHKVIHAQRNRQTISTSKSAQSDNRESSTKLTVLLLTISFTFLITTLPMNAMIIAIAIKGSYASSYEEASKFRLGQTISTLLMYTNHGINFYLYLLTGQKFRQELVAMFRECMSCVKARVVRSETDTQTAGVSSNQLSEL